MPASRGSSPPGIELVTLTSSALTCRFFTTSTTWENNVSLRVAFSVIVLWASLVAQTIKNLPMRETWVQSLGWEDPLEEGMVTHSSILAWEIPGTGEPGGMQSMGLQKSQTQRSD